MAVTRDSLQQMVNNTNPKYVQAVIGRALVAIFKRQTENEQNNNDTHVANNIGFSGSDARSGSLTAKFFLKHKRLEDWMIEKWTKRGQNGFSRITKYARQLNEISNEKD